MNTFRMEVDSLPINPRALAKDGGCQRTGSLMKVITAFACMAATPGSASIYDQKVNHPSAEVWKTFTNYVRLSEPAFPDSRSQMASMEHGSQAQSKIWVETEVAGAWVQEASSRINHLAAKPAGWKGEGSVAPSAAAISDSFALVQKLRAEGCKSGPMIGADEDGEIVFFWNAGAMAASISIEGDGSYSVYVNSASGALSADGCRIANPLPQELITAFDVFVAKKA